MAHTKRFIYIFDPDGMAYVQIYRKRRDTAEKHVFRTVHGIKKQTAVKIPMIHNLFIILIINMASSKGS